MTNTETRAYMQKWRDNNRDRIREYSKKHYLKNKEVIKKKHAEHYYNTKQKYQIRLKRNHLQKNYGITLERFEELLKIQDNKCDICKIDFSKTVKPCVDHCHNTLTVRGILCRKCNLSLPSFENLEFVKSALKYLDKTMK